MKLFHLVVAFLRPCAEGDDAGAPTGKPADAKPAPEADDQLDLDLPSGEEAAGGEDKAKDTAAELEQARREARTAKEEAERYQRELAEARIRSAPTARDEQVAVEDARLKDPNIPALERWQIESNRTLRQNTSAAQYALARANDVSDRTEFASFAIGNPVAKKYEARVEEELAKARAQGGNPARLAILKYMLGEDMLGGKFKKKASPEKKEGEEKLGVSRGRLPGARSDVGARSGLSEREKRIERLRNQQI